MDTLKISMYESGRSKSAKTVNIPFSKLDLAKKLLPIDARQMLDKEGIDILQLGDLSNKNISKGILIEVETGKDKIVISVE